MGHRGPEGTELDITNEELAHEDNITIFTASRLLSEWQRKGILTKRRTQSAFRITGVPELIPVGFVLNSRLVLTYTLETYIGVAMRRDLLKTIVPSHRGVA